MAVVKEQLVDQLPKRFKSLKFGIQSNQDIVNQAVLEVSDRMLYDIENNRTPFRHGPLDPRLGTSSKSGKCATCNQPLQACTGHFGHIKLPLPAFHIGYLRFVMTILQNICKECSSVLLDEGQKRSHLRELRRPGIDNMRRTMLCKKINGLCKKVKECPCCGAINGTIKKLGPLKLAHDKYAAYNRSTAAKKIPPEGKVKFDASFTEAKKNISELDKHLRKAMEDLSPLRVLNIFKKVSPTDCELLGLNPSEGRPEMFLWQFVPAPPICIRPSVAQDNSSTEDDLTTKLSEIVHMSGLIKGALAKGTQLVTIMEMWEFLQIQVATYVNSEVPGLAQPGYGKTTRGFCQRLKGKQGRFRGNLSGKRVDFSGRTVISPDPNLAIDEVAVPILVAKNMTYPERVNAINIAKLRDSVINGPETWPGAQSVTKTGGPDEHKINLKFGNRPKTARDLKYGDIVERHLVDGDVVLFNRQPSLHKLSIMSHLVKVRPWRTFRLNECACTPYNADFDGDEMNLHVPQTEEARAEALTLMGVKHNLATPKNGEPIIAATQDFITAAYLISSKDMFFTRQAFTYLCMHMTLAEEHLDIPPPAIVKPEALWTGKQVFSMLIRPNKKSNVLVNLDAKCRAYRAKSGMTPDMCPNDGWLAIRNSEVMCGRMDKSTVGGGKKDSIFYVILRDFGPDAAVLAMNRLAKLCARFLGNRGFSIGVIDVFPTKELQEKKADLVTDANSKCDELITSFRRGELDKTAGLSPEETLESKIGGLLSKVRSLAGDKCGETLSPYNAPLAMANSGSKGSALNVAQMVAVVGQQILNGKDRVADGFQDRTLPHFQKSARQPAAKGFVKNSFYSGLVPTEFLFHAISGREGLVDTAVKTAETGYMSRRLMKSLEDLSTQYDSSVRTSSGGIVQFQFGSDKLDPVDMEGSATPVNFDRTWTHAESLTVNHNERSLLPFEIIAMCKAKLDKERAQLQRRNLVTDEVIQYEMSEKGIDADLLEGPRNFIETIAEHVRAKADKLAAARELVKLPPCRDGWAAPEQPGMAAKVLEAGVERFAKVSESTLMMFLTLCLDKFRSAQVEPGHAVGAVGAQSIGEPGTQMTLKTFHFAGVAGMNLTQGVPRIKEIINASKTISTPLIKCPLENNEASEAAYAVKGKIEKTFIGDVLAFIEDEWDETAGKIILQIDTKALTEMYLGVGLNDIAKSILAQKKLKVEYSAIQVDRQYSRIIIAIGRTTGGGDPALDKRRAPARGRASKTEEAPDMLLRVNHLLRALPLVPICGYPEATRAVIETSEKNEYCVYVEGYGLRECMNTEGVVGTGCSTNSILECRDILGIEAARTTISREISKVMGDMNIDPRHMDLLADVMTYKGEVLGITRFGLSKMRDSVLQLASFEKTPDHLFEAAAGMKTDKIEGVSECIIMGQTMSIGTGAFKMVRRLGLHPSHLAPKPTVFEDAWNEVEAQRKVRARR